jgi:uncharacterized repeat protein (TIGR01451 family)
MAVAVLTLGLWVGLMVSTTPVYADDGSAPTDETAVVDETTPTDETTTVDETAPTDETTTVEETTPADETTTVDETAPTDETTTVDETTATDETTTVDETAPADEVAVPATTEATIQTDKADYAPTETPVLSGAGFAANTEVTITVTAPDGTATTFTATTDSQGQFTANYEGPLTYGEFSVTATDGANVVAMSFTDKAPNVTASWSDHDCASIKADAKDLDTSKSYYVTYTAHSTVQGTSSTYTGSGSFTDYFTVPLLSTPTDVLGTWTVTLYESPSTSKDSDTVSIDRMVWTTDSDYDTMQTSFAQGETVYFLAIGLFAPTDCGHNHYYYNFKLDPSSGPDVFVYGSYQGPHITSLTGSYDLSATAPTGSWEVHVRQAENAEGTGKSERHYVDRYFTVTSAPTPAPSYTIDKTVTDVDGDGPSGSVDAAGDVITYQVVVTNTGNQTLTGITFGDSLVASVGSPTESGTANSNLDVSEHWTWYYSYTAIQDDIDDFGGGDGDIDNTATVSSNELDDESNSEAVPIDQNPAYTIDKTVTDVDGYGPTGHVDAAGDEIDYQVVVTNDGNQTLTFVSLADTLVAVVGSPTESMTADGNLEVGETWTWYYSYTAIQDDIDDNGGSDGDIDNTATVDCNELGLQSDSEAVPVDQNPAYTIDKTVTDVDGDGPTGHVDAADDEIDYQVDVVNTGNQTLTGVSLSDSLVALAGSPTESMTADGNLEVGETWTWYYSYTATQADIDDFGGGDGYIDNTATVSSTELGDESDSEAVPIDQLPSYTIDKTVTDVGGDGASGSVDAAGDIISYQVVVTNDGNQTLTGILFGDSLVAVGSPTTKSLNTDSDIDVGENWTWTYTYTATQADIDDNGGGDGYIDNTATVYCDQLSSITDSAAAPIFQYPVTPLGGAAIELVLSINWFGTILYYPVDASGTLLVDVNLTSPDGTTTLVIPAGTRPLDINGLPLYLHPDADITVTMAGTPPAPPGTTIVAVYELLPSGATFENGEVRLIVKYDPATVATGGVLVMAYYDEDAGQWVELETAGYVVGGETVPNTVVTHFNHLTYFALLVKLPK